MIRFALIAGAVLVLVVSLVFGGPTHYEWAENQRAAHTRTDKQLEAMLR